MEFLIFHKSKKKIYKSLISKNAALDANTTKLRNMWGEKKRKWEEKNLFICQNVEDVYEKKIEKEIINQQMFIKNF